MPSRLLFSAAGFVLLAKAQIYATTLGVQVGTGGTAASPQPGTPAATVTPAPGTENAAVLPVNSADLVNYVQSYNESVLGQKPTNWGNIILAIIILLLLLGGGGFMIVNEKLVRLRFKVSFGDTRRAPATTSPEYPAEVVDMLPALSGLSTSARRSLQGLLQKPEKSGKVLKLIHEILAEIDLGLKEVARKLRRYLSRQSVLSERREKEEIIRKILPRIAKKLSDILGEAEPDIGPVVAKIMGNLLVHRHVEQQDGTTVVRIEVENHSDLVRAFKLHEVLKQEAVAVSPAAKVISLGDGYDYHWKLSLGPGESTTLSYTVHSDDTALGEPVVEGLDAEIVTGARVI